MRGREARQAGADDGECGRLVGLCLGRIVRTGLRRHSVSVRSETRSRGRQPAGRRAREPRAPRPDQSSMHIVHPRRATGSGMRRGSRRRRLFSSPNSFHRQVADTDALRRPGERRRALLLLTRLVLTLSLSGTRYRDPFRNSYVGST